MQVKNNSRADTGASASHPAPTHASQGQTAKYNAHGGQTGSATTELRRARKTQGTLLTRNKMIKQIMHRTTDFASAGQFSTDDDRSGAKGERR